MNKNTRTNVFKIPMNDVEDSKLRRLCSVLGVQRAPYVRGLINDAASAHVRQIERRREWPRHGRVANLPGRGGFGGATRPIRV